MIVRHLPAIFLLQILSSCEKIHLSPGYDPEELPPSGQDPLKVSGSINLRNILDISETRQQISLETTIRFYWQDSRVTPVEEYLHGKDSIGQYLNLHLMQFSHNEA